MIVLRTPKGWTGPEGGRRPADRRAPSAPTRCPWPRCATNPEHLALLEAWLRSYRPEELFDADGALVPELAALPPRSYRRMSANPHANGGLLLRDLSLPDFRDYAVEVPRARRQHGGGHPRAGHLPARRDAPATAATSASSAPTRPPPTGWAPSSRSPTAPSTARSCPATTTWRRDGRVMEVLSEHLCQGWLEGYLLTGRHGLFNCYEAFIHIVDSMFNQHAKWLKVSRGHPLAAPIASLNYLLTSHVWRQDHNGFSHQDPGFIDHVVNKKAEHHPRLPAAGRQHPALGRRPLPAQPRLRQRHRGRQAARAATGCPWTQAVAPLHARHRHLGLGQQRQGRRAGRRPGLLPATSRRWRRWPPSTSCASTCPT